jgi:hypothetical protein
MFVLYLIMDVGMSTAARLVPVLENGGFCAARTALASVAARVIGARPRAVVQASLEATARRGLAKARGKAEVTYAELAVGTASCAGASKLQTCKVAVSIWRHLTVVQRRHLLSPLCSISLKALSLSAGFGSTSPRGR